MGVFNEYLIKKKPHVSVAFFSFGNYPSAICSCLFLLSGSVGSSLSVSISVLVSCAVDIS